MDFIDEKHKDFFEKVMKKLNNYRNIDVYYSSIIYTLGISETTRKHFSEIFNLKEGEININSILKPWQTDTSKKVTRMAFSLWNGCNYDSEEDAEQDRVSKGYNIDEIFSSAYAPYFYEAIKIRYPEYAKIEENNKIKSTIYINVGNKSQLKQEKVAAQYIRLASPENISDLELLSQKQVLDNYCKDKYRVFKMYIDNGFCGLDKNRPGLNQMIEDLKKNEIDVIVVSDLSRLFRNPTDLIRFLESDYMKNIEIDSVDNSIEEFKKMNRLFKNVFNDEESEDDEEEFFD